MKGSSGARGPYSLRPFPRAALEDGSLRTALGDGGSRSAPAKCCVKTVSF